MDGATTAVYGVILWAALPETRPKESPTGHAMRWAASAILRDRVFLAVCLLTVAFSVIFFQSFVALPIDMRAHGISLSAFGRLIALNGVLIVLLQPFASELIRNRSRPSVLAVASLLLGIGFGLNAWIGSALAYAVSIAIWTLGEILFAPAATSLVADLAPPTLRGGIKGRSRWRSPARSPRHRPSARTSWRPPGRGGSGSTVWPAASPSRRGSGC